MVISEKFKFIFIHIPKNAGTSLSCCLREAISEKKHWAESSVTKHETLREVLAKKAQLPFYKRFFVDTDFDKYYTFAIVRNPYERMVSLFNYLKKSKVRQEIKTIESFNDFIYLLEDSTSWVSNLYSSQPQFSFLVDSNDSVRVDFIGRYERLDESVQIIKDHLKLKNFKLKRLNFSSPDTEYYKSYYNDDTEAIVRRKFEKDLELFDYSF